MGLNFGAQVDNNRIRQLNKLFADFSASLGDYVETADLVVTLADYALLTDLSDYLPLTGGTLSGALTLSGAPTNDLHAATKKYVDDEIAGVGAGSAPPYLTHALAGGI